MQRLASLLILLCAAGLLVAAMPRETGRVAEPLRAEQTGNTEPLAIIVNKTNTVDDLSMPELRRVFLGERSHWPNQRRITLVMREEGEPERKAMLHDVFQMSDNELKNHFLHGLFTGEILVSPKILASGVGVRKFVFNVPGAIGYVRVSDVDSSVKVIRVDELLPDDKGYRLRVEARAAN